MTVPDSCGETGGAVSLWTNITECSEVHGILTTVSSQSTGFVMFCAYGATIR